MNTLEKWLSKKNKGIKPINNIHKYFYYNKKNNKKALWFEKKPSVNFEKKVNVKELNEIIIVCGNIETKSDKLYICRLSL